MKKIILALATLVSISAFTTANATRSSEIFLGGGNLPATQEFNLGLSQLIKKAAYDITCDIIDDNNATNKVTIQVLAEAGCTTIGYINANDRQVGTQSAQFPLTAVHNQIVIHQVYASDDSAKIVVRNIDQHDLLILKNCVARASDLSQ